jgi:hypothetical protein
VRAFDYARTEGKVEIDAEGREFAMVSIADPGSEKYHEQDVESFEAAEKAGRLKTNTRGDYAEVEIPKKDGGVWKKKIYRSTVENPGTKSEKLYRDDITNPYDGPDQPEMLRKAAGKSFLGKYARVRNSEAAMDEVMNDDETAAEKMASSAIDAAFENIDTPPENAEELRKKAPEQSAVTVPPDKPDEVNIDDELFKLSNEEPPA